MIRMPPMGGPDQFHALLCEVPRFRHSELLGVGGRTLRRWCAPGGRPPVSAFQALFWHTRWGDSVIRSEYGFEAANRLHLAAELGARFGQQAANCTRFQPALRLVRSRPPRRPR